MFTGTMENREIAAPPTAVLRGRVLVAALAVFVLFFRLGTRGLNEPDEGRYSEVGREMVASGDWLVPRFNGVEHLSKPPVTYWLIAASIQAFGVNEWAARLPAVLAALGSVLALYLMVKRATDEVTGLWSAVVLLSCAQFFIVARLIATDMLVTCFATWSVWALWRWYTSSDRGFGKIMWFYVFLGLGMMTKGPPAVISPLFALAGLRWCNPGLKLRQLCWGRGLLVFLAIGLPWYIALAIRKPDLWHYFLVREIIERSATGAHGRSKTFWYFVPVMALGFLPWTMFLRKPASDSTRQRDFLRLCAGWTGLGFILFSIANSKLPTYVTPLYVPLAAWMALVIPRWKRWPAVLAGAMLAMYVTAVILFPIFEGRLSHQVSARPLAERILRDDPTGAASVVQYQTFMFGLPFYLKHPVGWYHPPLSGEDVDEAVYEFARAHQGENILNEREQLKSLWAGPQRVFGIVVTRWMDRLKRDVAQPVVRLEQAGDWTLVSNRP
jgi:4-amino-4-deoxy-L-arabinose transferase-like glycosyltransferase